VTLIQQGLLISLLGLALTFVALGILILTIVVLKRLFNPSPAAKREGQPGAMAIGEDEGELAAAIAAAVLLLRTRQKLSSSLGNVLEAGPGRWWQRPQAGISPSMRKQANGRDHS